MDFQAPIVFIIFHVPYNILPRLTKNSFDITVINFMASYIPYQLVTDNLWVDNLPYGIKKSFGLIYPMWFLILSDNRPVDFTCLR